MTAGTNVAFTAELDTGGSGSPANAILAAGSTTQTITAGVNTVSMTLNGVAQNANFSAYDATTGTLTFAVEDAASSPITTPGSAFDNGAVAVVTNNSTACTADTGAACTGTASLSASSVAAPNAAGNNYTTVVTCTAAGTVVISLASGSGTSAFTIPGSGAGSTLTYPAASSALTGTNNSAALNCAGATGHPTLNAYFTFT